MSSSTPFVISISLLLFLPFLLFFIGPRIISPPSSTVDSVIPAADEIEDLALFRRAAASASSVSHLTSNNPNPKFKIAFLFLTNTDMHFFPLWDRFFHRQPRSLYNIYVHADPSVNVTRPEGSVFVDAFISNAKHTSRASPTLISAARRLIATALLDDPANAYFALLSQFCVPLHSFSYVYRSLFESPSFDKSDPESIRFGIRIQYRSFIEILSEEPRLWKRYMARGRYAMMPEIPFENFRVGSQFFILNRKHALTTIKDRTLWKKFKLPCYRSDECYPEEHYFPTLLSMEDSNGCTGYTLTRVNWTRTVKGHPYMYRPDQVTGKLIFQLRESNRSSSYLFARKFSPDCLNRLMSIADSVIFRD